MHVNYEELPTAGLYLEDIGADKERTPVSLFDLPEISEGGRVLAEYSFVFVEQTGTFHFRRVYRTTRGEDLCYFSSPLKREEVLRWSRKYRNHIDLHKTGRVMGFDTRNRWQKILPELEPDIAALFFWASIVFCLVFSLLGVIAFPVLPFHFYSVLFYALVIGFLFF